LKIFGDFKDVEYGDTEYPTVKEHLLVSKALPIFRASYYFCACSDLSLLYEAYDLSSQSED
jgi:hypothetical protein